MHNKFTCPCIHSPILHREALVSTLMEVTGHTTTLQTEAPPYYKLVLLCAPAGYGKTTLLADFASQITTACCWYILDETDRDTMAFVQRLLLSIRSRFPDFGRKIDPLVARAMPADAQDGVTAQHLETIIAAITESIEEEISERFLLILSNYHEVNDHLGINALVNLLLLQLPQHCVLVVESRALPAFSSMDTLLLQRAIFGLLSNELRFTAQEVYNLAELLRHPLSYQDAEQVAAHFEGWIAGILLSTRLGLRFAPSPGDDAERSSPALLVNRKNLFSYLMNEVFMYESEVYNFLKDTSILSHMTPTLVNALLDTNDAEARLAYAEQHGFFVTRTGDDTYVSHPVLREVLAKELASQQPARFKELHHRAATLFQQQQDHHLAITHALAASAYDLAAQLICEISQYMLLQGHSEAIARWIDTLPPSTLEHYPQLLLSRANIWLMQYQPDVALPLLDQVARLLSSSSDTQSKASQKVLAESLVAHGFALWFSGEYAQAQEVCTQAIALLPEDEHVLRAMSYQQLGVATSLSGDYQNGIVQLQQALQIWGQTENRQTALLYGQLANAYDVIGNYPLAEHHRALAIRTCEHLRDVWGMINNLVGLSVTRMHQGAYPDAENILQQALTLARLHHIQRGEAYALVNLGVLYQDQDHYQQALSVTEDGLKLARQLQDRFLVNQALINLATNYLLVEDPQTALLLLSEVKIDPQTRNTMSYDACLRELILGSVFLSQRRYEEAYATLHTVERSARAAKWKRVQIKALIRLAVCQEEQGQRTAALLHIGQVLDLSKQKEYEHLVNIELRRKSALEHLVQMAHQHAKALPPIGHPRRVQNVLTAPHNRCSMLGFGEPAVFLDGAPVTRWRMSRTMELYFLLLESHRPVRKDQIMAALWPDTDEQNDQTLRSTIHYLRKAIGEECIVSLVGAYALNLSALYGDDVWYDVAAFREYASLAKEAVANKAFDEAGRAYQEMVTLYRGDYLQTCYSNWCIPYRDTLRTTYMDALVKLARLAWDRNAYDECLHYWQRQLVIDNCLEDAYYWIIRCYLQQGKRSLALRQYNLCRETLHKELSTVPGPDIEKIYQTQLQRAEQHPRIGSS